MRLVTLRGLAVAVAAALAGLAPAVRLAAQEPLGDRPGLEQLRERVRERVARRLQDDLGLTDDQLRRLRSTVGTYGRERRELQNRQRSLRGALVEQLRPGVAAAPDSVARLMNALADLRVRYAESYRAELTEMSTYLDPVQRARVVLLRERLAESGGLRRRAYLEGRRRQ